MFTYHPLKTVSGSNAHTINVDLNGQPFGQLWTFRNTRTTWNPWHAKPLAGEHKAFYNAAGNGGDLDAAKAYIEAHAS